MPDLINKDPQTDPNTKPAAMGGDNESDFRKSEREMGRQGHGALPDHSAEALNSQFGKELKKPLRNVGGLAKNDTVNDDNIDKSGSKADTPSSSESAQGAANKLQNIAALSAGKIKGVMGLFKRKKGFTVGTLIAIIVAAVISTTALGPLKFLDMAEMLQDFSFGDQDISMSHRVRNLVTYSQLVRGKDGKLENTRLGTIDAYRAHKIEKKLAASGIKIEYTRPGGRFDRITIDMNSMSDNLKDKIKGAKTDEARNAKIAEYYGIDASSIERDGSVISIKAKGKNKWATNRNITKLLNKSLSLSPNFSKKTTAIKARKVLHLKANVQLNPATKLRENAKSKLAEKWKEIQDERKIHLSSKGGGLDNLPDPDKPGSKMVKKIAASKISGSVVDMLASVNGTVATASTGVGILVAITQVSCTVRDSADMISDLQTTNKMLPMMAASAELMAVSSKIKAGQVDGEYLSFYNKSFSSPSGADSTSTAMKFIKSGGNFDEFDQKAFGENRLQRTFDEYPELDPNNKSNIQTANDVIQWGDNMYNGMMSTTPVFGQIITAYNALPAKDITPSDLSCGVVNLPGDLLSKVSDLVGPYIPGYSIIQSKVEELGKKLISWIAGSAIDLTDPKYAGAPFQESVVMGFRLFANEAGAAMGGSVLTDAQEASNKKLTAEYRKYEDERSLIAKTFDTNDYNSPAAKLATKFYGKNSLTSIASIPKQTYSNISSLFNKSANAQGTTSDVFYGIPKVGFDLEKLDKEIYEDPYANAEIVYERLGNDPDKKAHFTECTGLTITDNFDFEIKSYEETGLATYMQQDYRQKCKDMDTDETLYRTRLLALDTIALKSFSCLEFNDEESCEELLPEQKNNTACGEDTTSQPTGDTSDKLYWPIRNEGQIKTSSAHDFGVSEGTPVYAIKDGKVTESRDIKGCDGRNCGDGMSSYGRVVKIDHNINGKGPMVYAHLSKRIVDKGDSVKAGQIIGYSGNSGNSSGPHLHIDFNGSYTAVDWLKSQKPEIPPKDGNGKPPNEQCGERQVAGSGDYTDDTENPIPKGEQVAEQAKNWAKNDARCGFGNFKHGDCTNACLGIVSELWKSVGKGMVSGDTAWTGYKRYKSNGWVNKTKNIPIGAIMWSYDPKDANPVGHAYTYVGNGLVASNDIVKTGVYSVVPADLIESKWGHKFLGWSEWHE